MITIKDNNIKMIKGDTAYINIKLEGGYVYKEGDTLTLTVRKDIDSAEPVLTKTIAANENFTFVPEDTASLAPDRYVYDVQLDTIYEEVFTVVVPSDFILKEGVTRGE